jgi:spectinomycin phosphotransferase
VFVIDWDEVMLAPKERDFLWVREPHAGAFFQGYGQEEIDWMALTYFLWERVIQDVIECAKDVCFRDDLGEETKAEIARLFHASLLAEEGSTIAATYAAAAHLRGDHTVHTRDIS